MRFKVLCNGYQDLNGKNHKRGDIIESDSRLDESFGVNKFQLIDEVSPETPVPQPEISVPEQKAKKKDKASKSSPSKSGGKKKDKKKDKKKKKTPEIKEVTDEFPEAADSGYAVMKVDGKYDVIDTDDNEKVNDKPLAKDEVAAFIEEQIDSDDDDEDEDEDDDEE